MYWNPEIHANTWCSGHYNLENDVIWNWLSGKGVTKKKKQLSQVVGEENLQPYFRSVAHRFELYSDRICCILTFFCFYYIIMMLPTSRFPVWMVLTRWLALLATHKDWSVCEQFHFAIVYLNLQLSDFLNYGNSIKCAIDDFCFLKNVIYKQTFYKLCLYAHQG